MAGRSRPSESPVGPTGAGPVSDRPASGSAGMDGTAPTKPNVSPCCSARVRARCSTLRPPTPRSVAFRRSTRTAEPPGRIAPCRRRPRWGSVAGPTSCRTSITTHPAEQRIVTGGAPGPGSAARAVRGRAITACRRREKRTADGRRERGTLHVMVVPPEDDRRDGTAAARVQKVSLLPFTLERQGPMVPNRGWSPLPLSCTSRCNDRRGTTHGSGTAVGCRGAADQVWGGGRCVSTTVGQPGGSRPGVWSSCAAGTWSCWGCRAAGCRWRIASSTATGRRTSGRTVGA